MAPAIEELFSTSRLPGGLQFVIFIFYLPVGLALALLRVFIEIHAFIVAMILPKTLFLRRWVLRVMCTILGVVVTTHYDEPVTDEPSQKTLMVANSVSIFDHLALDLLIPNYVLLNKPCTAFWSWLNGYFSPQDSTASLRQQIDYFFRDSSVSLVAFPEGASTNGRAMLKFQDWPFDLDLGVRPVTMRAWRPLINVPVTVIESRTWQDLFWHLFCPVTVYNVRFLPVQKRRDSESSSDFSRRVQTQMSQKSNIPLTNFTLDDRNEFVKRRKFEERRVVERRPPPITEPAVLSGKRDDRWSVMCRQVKDVLPDVPVSVIDRDLRRTNNVDLTITNLLEGVTPYTPESEIRDKHNAPTTAARPLTTAVPAKCFSRSSRDRQLSLAERKLQLIENARARYLEKYGSQHS